MTRPWWLPGSQLVIMTGFVAVIIIALCWRAVALACSALTRAPAAAPAAGGDTGRTVRPDSLGGDRQ